MSESKNAVKCQFQAKAIKASLYMLDNVCPEMGRFLDFVDENCCRVSEGESWKAYDELVVRADQFALYDLEHWLNAVAPLREKFKENPNKAVRWTGHQEDYVRQFYALRNIYRSYLMRREKLIEEQNS